MTLDINSILHIGFRHFILRNEHFLGILLPEMNTF